MYLRKLLNHKGTDSVIVPGNQTFKYFSGQANLYGGELSIDIHPHPLDWLHFENTLSIVYSLNKSSISDSDKYLPFIPPVHTTSELRANFKKRKGAFANSYIKVEMDYYFSQDRVLLEGKTETPTPGYTLFSAGLGADVLNKKGRKIFSLHVLANNLLDAAYQNHLSRLKYLDVNNATGRTGIYDMGRNISFKAIVPFSLK
jgi:iron complex outermembrane receptor protein